MSKHPWWWLLRFDPCPSILDDYYWDFIHVQASLMNIEIWSMSKHPWWWLLQFDPCPSVLDYVQVFARSRKMVIPITHQSLVKNRDFNHSPITISNGDSNHSPITNQITLHNFLGSNFDYYISNKYSFSIITVVQSACQSILTYSLWASAVKFRQDFLLVDGTGKPKWISCWIKIKPNFSPQKWYKVNISPK